MLRKSTLLPQEKKEEKRDIILNQLDLQDAQS